MGCKTGRNDFQTAVEAEKKETQMAQIELTGNEIEMLRAILQKDLSELSLELAFTHRKHFLEFLKRLAAIRKYQVEIMNYSDFKRTIL